jgi:hypothetical protein
MRSGLSMYGAGDDSLLVMDGGTDWTRGILGHQDLGLNLHHFALDMQASTAQITGSGEQRHGIFWSACSGHIHDVLVKQPLGDGIFLWGGCHDCIVQDDRVMAGVTNNPRVGINFQGASQTVIRRNRVEGFDWCYKAEVDAGDAASVGVQVLQNVGIGTHGLALNGSDTGRCRDYIIEDNDFQVQNSWDCGVWLSRCDQVTVRRNRVHGRAYHSVYLPFLATDVLIEDNDLDTDSFAAVCVANYGGRGPCDLVTIHANRAPLPPRLLQVASGIDTLTLTGNHYKAGATLIMGADSVTHLTQSGNVGDL